MRILLIPPTLNCSNVGDVAMMQVALRRFREFLPGARIGVLTSDPAALMESGPGAIPVTYRKKWLDSHFLMGPFGRLASVSLARRAGNAKDLLLHHAPTLISAAVRARLPGNERAAFQGYLDAVHEADMVAAAGAGGFNDLFPSYTNMFLNTMALALAWKKRTAAFSQGLGPLRGSELERHARETLPRLELIALREAAWGPALVRSLGVRPERVMTSGDDAVELAAEAPGEACGRSIGVNFRMRENAGEAADHLETVRAITQQFALAKRAPLAGLPIARMRNEDLKAIRRILEGYPLACSDGSDDDTPAKVIRTTGGCRVVVTGAYHAAVFALARGIPAVCLAGSEYFGQKFDGLSGMFGQGCHIVNMADREFPAALSQALDAAWHEAGAVRCGLRARASQQIELSRLAYQRFAGVAARAARQPGVPTT